MAYVPMSSNARSGLATASASGVSIWDDASTDAILSTLGGGTTGIALFKDSTAGDALDDLGVSAFVQTTLAATDAANFRSIIGANGNLVGEVESADFTAASGKFYELDSSGGAIAVTMPACSADVVIGFKVKVAGNNITLTRAGSDTIDGNNTYVLSVVGEAILVKGDSAGTRWIVY